MLSTLSAFTKDRLVQYWKVPDSIFFRVLGMTIEVRDVQFAKACFPRLVTELGMTI